jgi:hypothetical protein
MKTIVSTVCALIALSAATAWAQAPALSYTLPAGVPAGQTVDVTLYGAELVGAGPVWSTVPSNKPIAVIADTPKNGTQPANVNYKFTIPAETPVGIYALRVSTPKGISNPRPFMVDDLPTTRETGNNKTPQTAQEVALPVAIDGACEAESFDYFRFHATAGQRVSVEVVARRLGSLLDPVIRLLDASGRELAYSDDEDATGADSRFSYRFTADGDYLLELRDIRYAGNAFYRYRLRLGDFPLATAAFPPVVQRGTTGRVTVVGTAVAGLEPIKVPVAANFAGDHVTVPVKYTNGQGSSSISLAVSSGLEQIEFEPNNSSETASPIELTGAVNGRFEVNHDRDYYRFNATKGQRFLFTGRTRTLGVPSDLFMRLYDAKGAKLAEADDSGTDEGVLDYTFPADGVYQLMVEDLLTRGSPEHLYRIEIAPYRPGFSLALDVEKKGAPEMEKFDVPKGGVFVTKVAATRRDYKGPITLSIVGIDGCTLKNETIAADKNDTLLTVTLPESLEPGQPRTFQIVGTAKINDIETRAEASTIGALRTLFSGLPNPPAGLDGVIGLGVGPVFADFFELAAEPKAVPFPQLIATTSFKVTVKKLNKFDDKIDLAVEGLPATFTTKVAAIDKGKAEAVVEVTGPKALAEGTYPLRIVGSATFQNQPKKVTLADVALEVVAPLGVTVTPAGPLTAGGKQKVKVKLNRLGGEKAPVAVSFKNLPQGVTAAAATIAEGAVEADIELTATSAASVGPAELVAVASTKIKDQQVSVTSAGTVLTIAKK